jgi:hypothetical protein
MVDITRVLWRVFVRVRNRFAGKLEPVMPPHNNLGQYSKTEIRETWGTHIQIGMIPPGGMTHGSDASECGGTIRPPETLRKILAMPLMRMNDKIPVITPYAILRRISARH